MNRTTFRLPAASLFFVVAVLVLVGCGGGDSPSVEPSPSAPTEATTEAAPPNDDSGTSTEPDIASAPLLDPPFALEIGDVALVLGGDIICRVAEDGIGCAEAADDGPTPGRYAVTVTGTELRVTLTAANGEAETVFLDTHVEPSSDTPLEPAEPQETVILEAGDALSVSGTDIVCVAGEVGFIGCSRLDDEGNLRSGTLAVGLDSAGVSVASVESDGTLTEVFSRTYDE